MAAVAVVLFLFFRAAAAPEFEIRIDERGVSVKRGKISGRFVGECQAICRDWGITTGTVKGVRTRDGVVLRFSPEVPPEHHQRFRNAWGIHS
jgi:hypothetical protein